jgi:hypothetical protein
MRIILDHIPTLDEGIPEIDNVIEGTNENNCSIYVEKLPLISI